MKQYENGRTERVFLCRSSNVSVQNSIFHHLSRTKSILKAMRESINESLAIENKLLSDENLRLRKAYSELLNEWLKLVQNKNPDNLIASGLKFWEDKIS